MLQRCAMCGKNFRVNLASKKKKVDSKKKGGIERIEKQNNYGKDFDRDDAVVGDVTRAGTR